jgi:hypothetical protein
LGGFSQHSLEKENAHKLFGIIFLWKCNKTQLTTFFKLKNKFMVEKKRKKRRKFVK